MHWRIFWGRERPWWDNYGWNKDERSEHFDEFFWLGRFSFGPDKRLEGSFRLEALKILWWDKYWLNLMGVMTRQCGRVVFFGIFQCECLFLAPTGLDLLARIIWGEWLCQEQVGDVFYMKDSSPIRYWLRNDPNYFARNSKIGCPVKRVLKWQRQRDLASYLKFHQKFLARYAAYQRHRIHIFC